MIYTDLFQAFVMIAGAVLITVLGLGEVGGFAGLREALPADYFHMIRPIDDPAYPWLGTTVGTMILGIWYWCTDQVIVQKTLAAKDMPNARGGTIFAAALKILPVFILVLPGLIAKALWPEEVTGDNAIPLLVQNLLPAGLRGLMIAAMLAALMSSLSSVFNSCSTLITVDIYKKLHPKASEKRLVFIGRANTAIIVALSIAWIPLIQYMNTEVYQYLQSVQASIGAPITAVFLCGVLWRGATARAALTTLIVGGVLGFGRFFLDVAHSAFGADLGPTLNGVVEYSFLNFSVFVFAFCLLLMISVSQLGERPLLEKIERLTLSWSAARAVEGEVTAAQQRLMTLASASVALVILSLWFHFR